MADALSDQEKEIDLLKDVLDGQSKIGENLADIRDEMANKTEFKQFDNSQNLELKQYKSIVEVQSTTIRQLGVAATFSNLQHSGLRYEKDEEGHILGAR